MEHCNKLDTRVTFDTEKILLNTMAVTYSFQEFSSLTIPLTIQFENPIEFYFEISGKSLEFLIRNPYKNGHLEIRKNKR